MPAAVGIDVQPGRKRPAVTAAAGVQVFAGGSSSHAHLTLVWGLPLGPPP